MFKKHNNKIIQKNKKRKYIMNNQKRSAKQKKCCQVEAVVSIDERGQILLPKDLRAKADLNPGDKLAVVTAEDRGNI